MESFLKDINEVLVRKLSEYMDFDSFVNDIEKNGWNVFGTEIYENGKLIHSWGDTQDCIHELYSATKTVLSVAFGILYDRGLIGLDDPILKYISEPAKPCWEQVTVRRLLTMSLPGLPFRAEGDNWVRFSLNCDVNAEEREFNYSNISTYLVGVALANILGSDLGKFIEDEIFAPLNIKDYEYTRSPEGYFYGASGMKLKVHDLSKFGLLLMDKGVYGGKRIISEEYVNLATSVQQMNREGGYGFYIWKYRDGFSINGKWKQKCYVLPARGIVVTYLSHIEDDSLGLKQSLERNILGFYAPGEEVVETDRLIMRRLSPNDYLAMTAWDMDERVYKYLMGSACKSPEEPLVWLPKKDPKSKVNILMLVIDKQDGHAVGIYALNHVVERDVWTLSYVNRYDDWGKGYTPEGMKALMDHAVKTYGARSFEGECAKENTGSARVMKKLGMAYDHSSSYSKNDGSVTFESDVYVLKIQN